MFLGFPADQVSLSAAQIEAGARGDDAMASGHRTHDLARGASESFFNPAGDSITKAGDEPIVPGG